MSFTIKLASYVPFYSVQLCYVCGSVVYELKQLNV